MARIQPLEDDISAEPVEHILCPICHRQNIPRARFCQHCGRDILLNNDGMAQGTVYRITRIIKQGGQGAVYEVVGEDGLRYAVKEMIERSLDPKELDEALARFELEANLLQRLSHPRIPKVYAHFKDEGRSYLAMDFVRGQDLEDVLRQGAMPEERVLVLADQICDVLGYLHQNGLIYRDMKPSNVMLEDTGAIKLVDFGIAKVFQKSDRATQIGTPGYAPPEQYQGIATVESDIYALGATLHHMLTGRDPRDEAPFSFPAITALAPMVSRRTADAIARALQMRPEDRFHSVAELRAELRPMAPAQQVRRQPAQQPVAMAARTQQAQVAQAQPAQPQPSVPPAPARPKPAPLPQAAQPIQPTQPAQPAQPVRRRGGFLAAIGRFFRNLIATAVLLLALTVAGWFFAPSYVQPVLSPYLPAAITKLLPSPTPLQQRLQKVSLEVTATVPATASADQVRQALLAAFAEQVKATYGDEAKISSNVTPAFIGDPVEQGSTSAGTTFGVTISGYILLPAQ
ncbi:protein kinase [Chloroflexia bacterium SDU3-3]|nr:protein kinase [Chloroflexia bacterium SDU3-3]